ncbi:TPA: hypothetical protein F6W46_09285 [Citrobacter freundii]|nr:hypothetical protein [Citrobacter freundii]
MRVINMNNELTAALLTIEKCRELSGCPAGVDLQDWVKQLAAENMQVRERHRFIRALAVSILEHSGGRHDWRGAMEDASDLVKTVDEVYSNTPATDRIVAGIKADGVEEFAAYCGEENSVFVEAKAYYRSLSDAVDEFATQLRKGAEL